MQAQAEVPRAEPPKQQAPSQIMGPAAGGGPAPSLPPPPVRPPGESPHLCCLSSAAAPFLVHIKAVAIRSQSFCHPHYQSICQCRVSFRPACLIRQCCAVSTHELLSVWIHAAVCMPGLAPPPDIVTCHAVVTPLPPPPVRPPSAAPVPRPVLPPPPVQTPARPAQPPPQLPPPPQVPRPQVGSHQYITLQWLMLCELWWSC